MRPPSKKKFFFSLCLILFLGSCGEEEDKQLRTNLPIEAQQLFSVSKSNYETLFLALTSWPEFLSLDGDSLPGCPSLTIDVPARRVTLAYGDKEECDGSALRSGVIALEFGTQATRWTMDFREYAFEGDTLSGQKIFRRQSGAVVNQSMEKFHIRSAAGSFTLNGDLTHSIAYASGGAGKTVSTQGTLSGINPLGRAVAMTFSEPMQNAASCADATHNFPRTGIENWLVGRGSGNNVSHVLSYQSSLGCDVTAKMRLPDGRELILASTGD